MTWLTAMEYLCHKWPQPYAPFVIDISRSFPHSWLITGFVTRVPRRVPLVVQELLNLTEHLRSPPVFSGVRVTRSLVLYVCFVDCCLSFCTFFLLAIVLSVLRYTDSEYRFGIFKLFLSYNLRYFHLAFVLFVLLRITNSDYPFGIFKLFIHSSFSSSLFHIHMYNMKHSISIHILYFALCVHCLTC